MWADSIDHRIWLGSIEAVENIDELTVMNISHVLSVINSDLSVSKYPKYVHKHIRVEDEESTDLLAEFSSCYEFIDKALSDDPNNCILIHCQAGASRSATIACMWLMCRYELSVADALKRLRLARPCVSPNRGFLAQLFLFEQMNCQFDRNHPLYKEFQLECALSAYLDHDTEFHGIEGKEQLRKKFANAFIESCNYSRSTNTKETYVCQQCGTTLFTNADILLHDQGLGLYDWFNRNNKVAPLVSRSEIECQQKLFTKYLKWLITQIDTPSNYHSNSITCPNCFSIVGKYDLNGAKCSCGRWVAPAFEFNKETIEQEKNRLLDDNAE